MATILSGIHTLKQHLSCLRSTPEHYRPDRCPHCGKNKLWNHGCYGRNSDRENPSGHSLNPVPIPRFRCSHCRATCSTLPECIPPRRWYLWQEQQQALLLAIAFVSIRQTCVQLMPGRKTLRRWRQLLQDAFTRHAACLRGRCSDLGRTADFESFWYACLERFPLSQAMIWVQRGGFAVS